MNQTDSARQVVDRRLLVIAVIVSAAAVALAWLLQSAGLVRSPFLILIAPVLAVAALSVEATLLAAVLCLLGGVAMGRVDTSVSLLSTPLGWAEVTLFVLASLGAVIVASKLRATRRGAQAVTNAEELYRTFGETVADFAMISDSHGRAEFVNSGWQKYTGLTLSEFDPEDYRRLHHPDDLPRLVEQWTAAQRNGSLCETEFRYRRHDGVYRWFAGRSTPIKDEQGRVVKWVGVSIDIDDRKRAEEELRTLNDVLERRIAQRTAEVEQRAAQLQALASELVDTEHRERRRLAQLLHDDLQQLLVAARMQVEAIAVQNREPRPAAERAARLLQSSIEVSRSITSELSPPALYSGSLRSAFEWLAAREKEKYGLQVSLRVDDNAEPGDDALRAIVFEAVRELLFNVVKHSGVKAVDVAVTSEGPNLRVVVSDQGRGFEIEKLGASPDSFGLFSIRERLHFMGGRVEFDSTPGKGTRITLIVPAKVAPAPAPSKIKKADERVAAAPPPGGPIRVLIADDHEMLRRGIAGLLSRHKDIRVIGEAPDGLAAVDLTRQLNPDVVIMDVTMPRMGGIEATRRINTASPHIRVIGLSMHHEDDMAAAMQNAGAIAYLAKDGPSDQLIETIRAAAASRVAETVM